MDQILQEARSMNFASNSMSSITCHSIYGKKKKKGAIQAEDKDLDRIIKRCLPSTEDTLTITKKEL